jgi:hypothetical protein
MPRKNAKKSGVSNRANSSETSESRPSLWNIQRPQWGNPLQGFKFKRSSDTNTSLRVRNSIQEESERIKSFSTPVPEEVLNKVIK